MPLYLSLSFHLCLRLFLCNNDDDNNNNKNNNKGILLSGPANSQDGVKFNKIRASNTLAIQALVYSFRIVNWLRN